MTTNLIKLIEQQGLNIEKISEQLRLHGYKISPQTLVKQIENGTIKFKIEQQILDMLGYKIGIKENNKTY